MRHRPSILALLGLAFASAGGVAVRILHYPESVPRWLAQALEFVNEPGVTLWWLTLGGLFQAFPSNRTGYVFVVLSSVLFWILVAKVLAFAARVILRVVQRLRA